MTSQFKKQITLLLIVNTVIGVNGNGTLSRTLLDKHCIEAATTSCM